MITTETTNFDAKLLEVFDHTNVGELTSAEKHRAYEVLKAYIPENLTAREYESEIKRITEYLEI